ncbi:MAG: sensor histidine kinase [Actinobacteria bacterium]|nr:sensor histidine kinase [Actinomycetota bacterium]
MLSVDELISSQTALTNVDRAHLMELLAGWQLLSDLSFADLILWIPKRKDYQSWPDGHIAMAHIRPTTAATVFAHDVIGNVINWGSNPRIDGALSTGEIDRDSEAEMVGEILIKEETVPVYFAGRVIAVISRHRNAELMRSPSRLELNYREIAHKIYQMVAEGTFPIQNSFYRSESAPRVGDGLVRLDANGLITYASPNARSAFNRAGWSGELESHQLGDVIESVKPNLGIPTDESWRSMMSGKNLRREEFENESGIFDLLVMPLVAGSDHIGAIVLLHNVTELRRRDRALVTKDVTIREIHHRVKNNLQTVSALLRLQSRRVEDETAKLALEEAVRRVASIAIVHETLSNSSTESVAFDEVYDRIVHNAIELSTHKISIEKLGTFGTFDSQIATPLALVITELIHNALEHGLANSGEKLRIEIVRTAQDCEVKIIDDGVGLPTDFNWDQSSNLGLQIVKTLTENELKGSIELVRVGSETQAVLKF